MQSMQGLAFSHAYWTPYRGIEMLIRFPWKGSGGGVVYGFGVWRVKSWVKNVLNTNKYIAISPIKWGWSPLTYLPLVVIIFEKSIILFYWTPYRGIDTLIGLNILFIIEQYSIEPLIGGLIRRFHPFNSNLSINSESYWTPYRGIETCLDAETEWIQDHSSIEPLIGGLRPFPQSTWSME